VSFFDDGDDAIEEEPRRSPRPSSGARPRSGSPRAGSGTSRSGPARGGSARGPATQDTAIERRRIGAGAVIIVVVILAILLISSCQARNTKNSLENYNNGVSSLINRSDATSRAVFSALTSGGSGATIQSDLTGPLQNAKQQLSDAQGLSVPGQMSAAQAKVVLAFQMRVDGISQIANAVTAINGGGTAATEAVKAIAGGTARFYASDVAYKDYATVEIAGALHGDNIPVGTNGSASVINGGQFLPELGWLDTTFITTELGASVSSGGGSGSSAGVNSTTPGLHGEALDATSVGSTTLQPTGTTIVPASPAPTFTVSVTDAGDFNQYGVSCTVAVVGGPSGTAKISELTPQSTQTCAVKLSSAVTPGTYQVTVTVSKVPGETNTANNTATYSVEFQ
jgi:hypothetical protein